MFLKRRRLLLLLMLLLQHAAKPTRNNRVLLHGPTYQVGGGTRKRRLLLQLISDQLQSEATSLCQRRWHVRPTFTIRKSNGCWYSNIQNMKINDPEKFFNHLRVTPQRFEDILYLLTPYITKVSIREPISPGERLAATLRYLASGDSMISTSYNFLLGVSTVSKIILETCQAMWDVLGPLVFEQLTEQLWTEVAKEFAELWQFPNCIGALDGKHCVVQKFARGGSNYYNYKGTNSIVLLGVCDARYKFLLVDIGARGRRSDGGVLQASKFGQKLTNGDLNIPPPTQLPNSNITVPHVIVGDEAFPLTEHIMRPFPGSMLEDYKIIYNYRLSRARRVIENAFGVLSARWRILRKAILASEKTANAIVRATVCLHNYIMKADEAIHPTQRRYNPPGFVDSYDENGQRILGRWRQEVGDGTLQPLTSGMRMGARNHPRSAQEIRENFVDYFLGEGQVPWQWNLLPMR